VSLRSAWVIRSTKRYNQPYRPLRAKIIGRLRML
jgi:hypothetical protein